MTISRRNFLQGLAAAMVAANAPPSAVYGRDPFTDEWLKAVIPIYQEYTSNVFIYGVGALQTVDEFPYIRSVDPRELEQQAWSFEERCFTDDEYGKTLVFLPTGKMKGLL